MTSNDIQSIVLIGGGAHLGGLQQKMEETIKIKVRMGQNPLSINILNSNINRMEYIEVFALLAQAAEMIEDRETCVELNKYEDDLVFEGGNAAAAVARAEQTREREESEKPEKPKKKGPSRWDKLRNKLSSLMTEDEPDNDD